jgi:hypothetical protein
VCYPTADIGTEVGQVTPNWCFDDGTTSFCLAQLYDPQGKLPARLIHMTVMAAWNGPSNEEADFIAGTNTNGDNPNGISWAKELAPNVVFLDVLIDGPTFGTGATTNDLQAWISAHGDVVPTYVDPTEMLGVFFDGAAVPCNIDIDAHTMKIVAVDLGFDTNLDHTLETLLASMK